MRSIVKASLLALSVCSLVGCDGAAKPAVAVSTGTASASVAGAARGSSAASGGTASAAASAASSASATASSSAAAAPSASAAPADALDLSKHPALFDADQKPLPQTEDRPSTDSPAFKRRMELLWQAIVADDPQIAEGVFFPVSSYELVKDIENAKADWKSRLFKAFGRNVHEYHKKLGDDAKAARFLGVEVDEPRVKWMKRGSEGNKLGYFRVTRSRIRYADAAGKEHKLELTSLISWRGEWFVVHLHGFK